MKIVDLEKAALVREMVAGDRLDRLKTEGKEMGNSAGRQDF